MGSQQLITAMVPGAIIVSEAGLLGWSWYRAVGGGQIQTGSSRQKLPVWLVALVTLDFATLAVFRFVLGGEGFFPQADTTQKAVVMGSALAALAAGAVGVRRPARGRTPFVIACVLLAAAWSLLAYLLFTPVLSGPMFREASARLRRPPADAHQQKSPTRKELGRLALESGADELEPPTYQEQSCGQAPEPVNKHGDDKSDERKQDQWNPQAVAEAVYGVLVAGRILCDPVFPRAVSQHGGSPRGEHGGSLAAVERGEVGGHGRGGVSGGQSGLG